MLTITYLWISMTTSSLIIIDGNILSMDEEGSTYEALHIRGNKIKCLGTNKEVLKNKKDPFEVTNKQIIEYMNENNWR